MRLRDTKKNGSFQRRGYFYVIDWLEHGKRHRKFFRGKRAAETEASQIRARLGKIPTGEPATTPEEFRAVLEARAAGVPLMDAVTHWKRTAGASGGRTMADLITARLTASKADSISAAHRTEIGRVLELAKEAMGALLAASVNPTDCQAFIASAGTGFYVQRKTRAILGSVFSNAMQLGWLTFNPASRLRLARQPHKDTIAIFTPVDAAEWIRCVATKSPSCLAGWAIALFAGLRAAEVRRLDWSEVKNGRIEVTAQKSKTRTRRLVDIQPNLAGILAPLAEKEGRVYPLNPERPLAWAQREYGRKLPRNGARHSFVSYHLALFGDVKLTAMQAGHSEAVLFQHYRELVTKEEAEAYFGIGGAPLQTTLRAATDT